MKTRSMSSIPCSRAASISRARRRPELRLHLAAEAAERGRGEHGLPRAADADREVVVRAADRGGDRRGHVAVLDQLDAGAGVADLLDQVVVARPVEDDRRHVVRRCGRTPRRSRAMFSPTGRSRSICPRARGPTAILRMYMSGSVGSVPGGADGDHRDRAVAAARDDAAALERVEREVDRARRRRRSRPAPRLLARPRRAPITIVPVDRQLLERARACPRTRPPPPRPGRRGRASARRRGRRARSRARSSRRGRARADCSCSTVRLPSPSDPLQPFGAAQHELHHRRRSRAPCCLFSITGTPLRCARSTM